MAEVPWFNSPPNAELHWSVENDLGHLHFIDPNGERAVIPVTKGQTHVMRTSDNTPGSPVWHIAVDGSTATVSPSVHFVGKWHSPNPVKFNLVDDINV